jgi:hypothetical protein
LLQRPYLPRHYGLRDVQTLGGPAKVELFGDCDEIADLAQVQIRNRADARKLSQRTEPVLDFSATAGQHKPSC